MIGSQQARIIGILRTEYEKDSKSFLSIKEIYNQYKNNFPDTKTPNYKTIATILKRLSESSKINHFEKNNRLFYRYKNIEEEVTNSLLKIIVNAFGISGLSHLSKKTDNLSEDELNKLIHDYES